MPPRARPLRLALSFALALVLLLLFYRRPSISSIPSIPSIQESASYLSEHLPIAPRPPAPLPHAAGVQTPDEKQLAAVGADAYAASQAGEAARRKALHDAKAKAAALSKRVIVASKKGEDTVWTEKELPEGWESWVYVVDDREAKLRPPANKGREAGVYLWYLWSEYDNLAETNVFMHAHRSGYPKAWHVDNEAHSNPLSLRRLRLDTVQQKGYVSLRCLPNPGCPEDVQPFRDPPDPNLKHEIAMPAALRAMEIFDSEEVPEVLAAPCCSQFAVSKTQIQKRSKAEYERYYKWIRDTELEDAVSGRVLEYLWHVIFGLPPVYCPEAYECYCDVYGDGCLDGLLDLGLEKKPEKKEKEKDE